MKTDICIIGAGISGLTAANYLYNKNINFIIIDKNDKVGGRIQTDMINGYRCDRGFQVLLPAYPTAKKYLNYQTLNLKTYPKGAISFSDKPQWFGAPFLYPKQWKQGNKIPTTIHDWLELTKAIIMSKQPTQLISKLSTNQYFSKNFSPLFYENFLLPFFQGVFLEKNCNVTVDLFRYYLRLFFLEGAAIPKNGMQAIPDQLAQNIPNDYIQLNSEVTHIEKNTIHLKSANKITAKKIIYACDYYQLTKLIPELEQLPDKRPVTTTFFSSNTVTNLAPLNFIFHHKQYMQLSIPTLIQQNYSEKNDHLCMISVLNDKKISPNDIKKMCIEKCGNDIDQWKYIHTHQIKYSLPYPKKKLAVLDKYNICGDWLSYGSIETSMKSGEYSAKKIIN